MSSRSFGSRIDPRSGKADVGFGSFYNHFSTKSKPFEAAVADVLEELGELFDRLSLDVEDAATACAQSVRLMLRLCRSRPQTSAVLVREGMHYMESEGGVAPRLCATSGRAWHRAGSSRPSHGWPEPPSPVRCWPRRVVAGNTPPPGGPYDSHATNRRVRVPHCSADNSRITLSTYRLARGRRVHSSAVSSRQAARYSSEIRCRSATKLGSVPISEIS